MPRVISRLLTRHSAFCEALTPHARYIRTFTSSQSARQDDKPTQSPSLYDDAAFTPQSVPSQQTYTPPERQSDRSSRVYRSQREITSAKEANKNILSGINTDLQKAPSWLSLTIIKPPYHLHCYSTKHNTHVTLTNPDRSPLISISCGNLGFRKGARGTYEAAFQTSAWVMRRMAEKGCFVEGNDNYITKLEVVMRGFAEGRQAFVQALMGIEGRLLRPKVVKVSDGTRIAVGGPRAPNPRRLG